MLQFFYNAVFGAFLLHKMSKIPSSGNSHGEKYFVSFGVDALQVVILQLDSHLLVDVKKSFACCTDLELVIDHVSDLSSLQESIVLLCLLLFM